MIKRTLYTGTLATLFTFFLITPVYAAASEDVSNNPQGIHLEDVQRFSNAINEIKKYYVTPVKDKALFDNAIRGMLAGLDPHSAYLDETDFASLQTETNGSFGGVGLEITMEDGVVKIISPMVDTPSFKAGIKSGDYVIKIGSAAVQGLQLQQAVNLLRGKIGEPVELTILRKGVNKPLTFTLVRENIKIKSIQSKLLDTNYGYVRITQFQALTDKDMLQAVAQLKQASGGQLKGLVLDLRNNPGGLLDSAIQVSDAFLEQDETGKPAKIVYTVGRSQGSEFTAYSNPGDILNHAPMVVLINNGSASASEIVAGALKDNKRAVILGTRSFGKGSVQTVLPLDNKRAIKLTTALYYTPSGTSIQAKGIVPDIVIEEVAIPKTTNASSELGYSEADLSGHVLNPNQSDKATNEKALVNEDTLLHQDYQLYAALTILKGLAVAKR